MADIATTHVNDLIRRIKSISAVSSKVVYVYDQDALLDAKQKLSYPAVGVVYLGLKGKTDSSLTGKATNLVCDIYLLGAESCNANTISDKDKQKATKILDDMRNAIICDLAPSKRKWKFVLESPIDVGESILSYIQRWETTVVI